MPDMLAGGAMNEVGRNSHQGGLLDGDPLGNLTAIVERACVAARELDDLDPVVHTSFGDFSAGEYLWPR